MTLFCDNDVIIKLAAWDLLEQGIAALGFELSDVRVLPTTRFSLYVAKRSERGVRRFGAHAHARIRRFLQVVRESPEQPHPEDEAALQTALGIDVGEAILFSATSRAVGARVATGDKRSLEALASAPACRELSNRLAGRVLCMEQIVLRAIDALDFELVRERVVQAMDIDTAVGAAFGSVWRTEERNARHALHAYIEHLRRSTGGLLAP